MSTQHVPLDIERHQVRRPRLVWAAAGFVVGLFVGVVSSLVLRMT